MAKSKWKKIIVAGMLIMEAIYPAINGSDRPKTRAGKKNLSSAAQQRMNQIYSWQKLELLLAANYMPGDLVCTFTYDDVHLPATRKECEARLKYFRAKLSAIRKAAGRQLVMFWNIEHRHGDGRWHHHVVINATGDDYKQILRAWGQGEIEIEPLRVDKEKNYATLAKYMCKEERDKVGLRGWSYTRNAKKPEVETFRVDEDTTLQIPKGAVPISEASERTEYGSYRYIKYLSAGWTGRRRTKAKRRRKRRA